MSLIVQAWHTCLDDLATRSCALYNAPPFLPRSFSPFPLQTLKDLVSFYLHAAVGSWSLESFAVIWDIFAETAIPVIPFWARAGEWNTAEQLMPCTAGTETIWTEEKSFTSLMSAFPHYCTDLIIFWPGTKLTVGHRVMVSVAPCSGLWDRDWQRTKCP